MKDIYQDKKVIENFVHQWQMMCKISQFNCDHAENNINLAYTIILLTKVFFIDHPLIFTLIVQV